MKSRARASPEQFAALLEFMEICVNYLNNELTNTNNCPWLVKSFLKSYNINNDVILAGLT